MLRKKINKVWETVLNTLSGMPWTVLLKNSAKALILISLAVVAVHYWKQPVAAEAKWVQMTVITFSFIGVLFRFLTSVSLLALINGLVATLVMSALIGVLGDAVMEEPLAAGLTGLSLVLSYVVFRCSNPGVAGLPVGYGRKMYARADLQGNQLSEVERVNIAAHEAGHALMFASWSPLPESLEVVVRRVSDDAHNLGYVSGPLWKHLRGDKTMAEWDMLLGLAGNVAEKYYTSRESLGNKDDFLKWMNTANIYLANFHRGTFYQQPETEAEVDSNRKVLDTLREEQRALLRYFFEVNRDTHSALTRELLRKGELSGVAVTRYLEAVTLPDEFPRVTITPEIDYPDN